MGGLQILTPEGGEVEVVQRKNWKKVETTASVAEWAIKYLHEKFVVRWPSLD